MTAKRKEIVQLEARLQKQREFRKFVFARNYVNEPNRELAEANLDQKGSIYGSKWKEEISQLANEIREERKQLRK